MLLCWPFQDIRLRGCCHSRFKFWFLGCLKFPFKWVHFVPDRYIPSIVKIQASSMNQNPNFILINLTPNWSSVNNPPKRSILGPLLSLIYIKGIFDVVTEANLFMFADMPPSLSSPNKGAWRFWKINPSWKSTIWLDFSLKIPSNWILTGQNSWSF